MKFKKHTLLILSLLLFQIGFSQLDGRENKKFSKADTLRGMLSPERACYNVLSYDLDVKVDIDDKFISGSNTIKFISEQDFQKLQIDLFANMKIEKIELDGIELKYTREYNAVFVTFLETIKKGQVESIKIYYSGHPQSAKNAPWDGGFSWKKDQDENPWVGVSCQGTGASCWWPCKDHQSDEPENMFIRITVPPDLVEVSNGRLKQTTALPNGWTKYEWYVSYPINSYDVTLNIAKYKHLSDSYINPVYKDTLTLDYYVLSANYNKAKEHFKQIKPMLDCYSKLFGEYPFVRDGYKLVETPYLGMEHQSCVSYGNKYLNGYLGKDMSGTGYHFDYIIIHESAHEWWGNSVTTNDIADMWIHEGFATYSEALYIECLYGYDAYLKYINSEKKSVKNTEPIIGKYGLNNKGSDDMYPKGSLLLHTIRGIINNDTLFFKIINGIQDTFRYHNVNSGDIEKYISQKSGIDFSDIFDLYLRGTSIPKLIFKIEVDSVDLKIEYRYKLSGADVFESTEYQNKHGLFKMPVKITFKKDEFHFIYPTTLWKTIIIHNMKKEDFKVADDLFYMDTELNFVNKNKVQPINKPK